MAKSLDERAKKLAGIIIDYSVNIQPTDTFLVQAEHAFSEFAEFMGKLAEEKGANVIYDYRNLNKIRELIERNDKEELIHESKRWCDLAEKSTARAYVYALTNPLYLKGVDPNKITDYEKLISRPFLDRITGDGKNFKGIKWNIVAFPCEEFAKNSEMGLKEYENFVYRATNIDWERTSEKMGGIKRIFDNAEDIHIIVPQFTDFHLSLKGRGGGICSGKHNMPDGEVYYSPVEDSANGTIFFPYTSIEKGNEVSGIKLEYKTGDIISSSAKENNSFLESMLNTSGAKKIGEFGIGCNTGITKYSKNTLFDEKINGTIHIAVGRSSKKSLSSGGGLNKSDIHWDLVCDLRKINGLSGGEIYVDGKLIQKNGAWVFE